MDQGDGTLDPGIGNAAVGDLLAQRQPPDRPVLLRGRAAQHARPPRSPGPCSTATASNVGSDGIRPQRPDQRQHPGDGLDRRAWRQRLPTLALVEGDRPGDRARPPTSRARGSSTSTSGPASAATTPTSSRSASTAARSSAGPPAWSRRPTTRSGRSPSRSIAGGVRAGQLRGQPAQRQPGHHQLERRPDLRARQPGQVPGW